jgi:hypothetical protein
MGCTPKPECSPFNIATNKYLSDNINIILPPPFSEILSSLESRPQMNPPLTNLVTSQYSITIRKQLHGTELSPYILLTIPLKNTPISRYKLKSTKLTHERRDIQIHRIKNNVITYP